MASPTGTAMLRMISGQRIAAALFDAHPAPMSRAELARTTGLSKPTVSALMSELEAAGLVREASGAAAARSGSKGRPATLYELVPTARHCVVAVIGATKLLVGLTDLLGNVVTEDRLPTGPDARSALENLADWVGQSLEERATQCHSACVGVPGIYRPEADRVEQSLSLPGFEEAAPAQFLAEQLEAPVFIENDVNLAALGELSCLGSDEVGGDFAAVFAGTGIGLGLVVDGELYRGGTGSAGELGSLVVAGGRADSPAVTLEDVASAPAICKRLGSVIEQGHASALDLSANVGHIFAAAVDGDPAARVVFEEVADAMALAASTVCLVADPTRIVFGGTVGSDQSFVSAVRQRLERLVAVPPALTASTLDRRAPLLGAASLLQRHVRESLIGELLGAQQ